MPNDRYIRAVEHVGDYMAFPAFRDGFHADIEVQRKALPELSEDEHRFLDVLTEHPLLTLDDAAELAGFSKTMATTLAQDERIKAHLRFHTATVRLMKVLREAARTRPDLIDDQPI